MTQTFTAPHDLDLALTAYASALEQKRNAEMKVWASKYPDTAAVNMASYHVSVTFEPGSKYLRVVMADGYRTTGTHRSAYAFIVAKDMGQFKVGDILKAASWKAPAKNFARGNVFRPETYERHSPYGL